MKFERTDKYNAKLFEQALFDEKNVIRDASIQIFLGVVYKLKEFCEDCEKYLQYHSGIRENESDCGKRFTADVVEVIRTDGVQKYYRAMKGSIRRADSDEVVG
jgi:hypothetical protein